MVLTVYFFLILIMICFLTFFSFLLSKKKKKDFEKISPFECGFNIFNLYRNPFSLRFFLISIIFLVFDIEIVILIPFILSLFFFNSLMWIILMTSFMVILTWGLMHEWFLGSLNWI